MFLDWGPLRGNVTESFRCKPCPRDWSNLFQKEIIFAKKLCFWIEAL